MTHTTKDLKAAWQDAEARAQDLQAKKDEAIQNVRDRFVAKLQDATDKAAHAQRAYLQAEAAQGLVGRDDAGITAARLIEEGGLTPEAVEAAGITLPE
jgi:DNA-nicking Smr family endonuclease